MKNEAYAINTIEFFAYHTSMNFSMRLYLLL